MAFQRGRHSRPQSVTGSLRAAQPLKANNQRSVAGRSRAARQGRAPASRTQRRLAGASRAAALLRARPREATSGAGRGLAPLSRAFLVVAGRRRGRSATRKGSGRRVRWWSADRPPRLRTSFRPTSRSRSSTWHVDRQPHAPTRTPAPISSPTIVGEVKRSARAGA